MKRFLENRWLIFALRIVLGGIFLYAGASKIGNPLTFADSLATFKLLPPQLLNVVALSLPPFEILLGVMLISGLQGRPASLGVTVLAIVFGVALGQALARGLVVDCGCFGSGQPSIGKTWWSFVRAGILFLAAAWLYFTNLKRRLPENL